MKITLKNLLTFAAVLLLATGLMSFALRENVTKIYLIGDSTMMDYDKYREDYLTSMYPLSGWGQFFQELFDTETIASLGRLIHTDSVLVDNRAIGGRSTRSFFEEGRWAKVYQDLRPGDLVMIQFGHNDATLERPLRYVTPAAYKEFIRLYVSQSREKGAIPIVVTPVSRNFPWKDGKLENAHGDYYTAAVEVSEELEVRMIDLTMSSMALFQEKGEEFSAKNYFMNLEPGQYPNYPEGKEDNTHFVTEGAREVAKLVLEGMRGLE
ncbi:rhamnogalacturonan acetylesterase [Algoriphagus sp. H41]|uniref:Rhamnogalacturonan acetylesterase n=1 Tax=Algoriphagus oliviformis TaxID=2811231 RepID=A0ABS3C2F7_9BACT|nr:rhamnogalacturonan acetylesterase [Algoriphagus oliviformis]MBN7811298.1 rhamnogalacturonan acetylesterase [Algoriphagus oliviformis]